MCSLRNIACIKCVKNLTSTKFTQDKIARALDKARHLTPKVHLCVPSGFPYLWNVSFFVVAQKVL